MLSLDDPHWQSLRTPYGPAGDVPQLIRGLPETFAPLYDRLMHQGDVAEAAFWVVPHLVGYLQAAPRAELRDEILELIGFVCVEGGGARGEVPGYADALERVREWVLEDLPRRPERVGPLLMTLAAVAGSQEEAELLRDLLVQQEFTLTCPDCWAIVTASPDDEQGFQLDLLEYS